jgi:urea transport system substrate-binding protein
MQSENKHQSNHIHWPHMWVWVILLLVVVMLGSSTCAAPSDTPAQLTDAPPIKVGLLHSLSGTLAISEIPVRDAALLAIDELNAAGGVLGRKVVPVVADGASDWDIFAEEARRLIREEEVATIFGCWTSASRKAVLPVVEEENALLWYPVQYEGLEQSPNIIYLGATTNQQIIPAMTYLLDQNHRRFFLLGSDYVFPRTANEIIKAQLRAQQGVVVGETYKALGATDFADVIEFITVAQPDVIINTLNGDSNVAFFQQFEAAGYTAAELPLLSVSIAEEEIRAIGAEHLVNHLAAWNYFQTTDTPANAAFVAAYREKYGERRVTSDPIEAMYVGVHLWALAVERAGTTDVDQVRAAARGLEFAAPAGHVMIDPDTQHLYKTVRIGRVNLNGQFAEIWNSGAPVEPDPFLHTYAWATEFHQRDSRAE